MQRINVALVGLGFGWGFVPIYADHPDVGIVGVYDVSEEVTHRCAAQFGVDKTYGSFEEILADESIDAVHLISPIPDHAEQTICVLESGKHCACTVPMATTLEDLQRIVDATRRSGKNYMMMETILYTYQFHYVQEMIRRGEMGKIQFLRGSHYQDMCNWPPYWNGLPPMWYGTHAIGPMTVLSGGSIKRVHAFGSGTMDESRHAQYGNPYPVETAIFDFGNGLKGEATRSLFETARPYQEGLFVYGSKACFEWGFGDGDAPYVSHSIAPVNGERGGRTDTKVIDLPNYYHSLPESIRKYTVNTEAFDPLDPAKTLEKGAGGGHHGSHPHLVHEFVRSIIEGRKPWIDENLGANITAGGICAHISAMKGGEEVIVPKF